MKQMRDSNLLMTTTVLKIMVSLDIPDIRKQQSQDKWRCVYLLHVYYH